MASSKPHTLKTVLNPKCIAEDRLRVKRQFIVAPQPEGNRKPLSSVTVASLCVGAMKIMLSTNRELLQQPDK
jgi:hypothetical protein